MAIKPCKECGAQVSDQADACPNCGAKLPRKTKWYVIVLAGLLAVAGIFSLFTSNTETEQKNVVSNGVTAEEEILLAKFSDATKAKNLNEKCKAAKELMDFYNAMGNKGKADMAIGILKRDCNQSN